MTYSVYVGNLPTTVSTEQLKNLFSQVDEVLDVWINPLYERITYGFIKFSTKVAAEEACQQFDNLKLDYSQIKVNLKTQSSNETQSSNKSSNKSSNESTRKRDSILLELPKKTGVSKNHLVKINLLKTLRQNKDIMEDFKLACKEMEDIPFSDVPHILKTAAEPTDLTTLETTVTRYFKKPEKHTAKVDFDLSKGKLLTNEQYDRFFNVQFTKPRPVVSAEKIEKKRPLAFDYRSVCDDFF